MLETKRIRSFPASVKAVTFNRASDQGNYCGRVFLTCSLHVRRKNDLEASALKPVKHGAVAYAVRVNRIHAADKRPVRINRASVSVPIQERANFIGELVKRDFSGPRKRENVNVNAASASKNLKPLLFSGRDCHPKFLAYQMPAAFAALDASPHRNHAHFDSSHDVSETGRL